MAISEKRNFTPVTGGVDRFKYLKKQGMKMEKLTNPKDPIGYGKPSLSNIPGPPLFEVGLVMTAGGYKYGSHNYRAAGVRSSVYFNAAMRHLWQWWEGEDYDEDTGLPHLAHAMACCLIIRDSELNDNHTDDRPHKNSLNNWMNFCRLLNYDMLKKYNDIHKQPKEPHIEIERLNDAKT